MPKKEKENENQLDLFGFDPKDKIKFKELEKIAKENAAKAENDTYKQFLKDEAVELVLSQAEVISEELVA